MAGGFAKDGAVQDRIDASLEDEVNRARSRLPQGGTDKLTYFCSESGSLERVSPRKLAQSGTA